MFFRKLKLDIKPKITLEHGQADRQTERQTDGRTETNARNDGKQEGTERLM